MGKIVNIFSGPGSGKSMFSMELATLLKKRGCVEGFTCEYVSEVAKEYAWEGSGFLDGSEKSQLILLGEQLKRLERLSDKVDIVVTDSPIILNALYNKNCTYCFENMILHVFNSYNNQNFFLNRRTDVPYEKAGRVQTFEEALAIDKKLKVLLNRHGVKYIETGYEPEKVLEMI